MRTYLRALVIVAFLAVPSLGVINLRMSITPKVLTAVGQTAQVELMAWGTSAGVMSIGGNIIATAVPDRDVLSSSGFAWEPQFASTPLIPPINGGPLHNGGWGPIGSQQTDYLNPDPSLGKAGYVTLASYVVTCIAVFDTPTVKTLTFWPSTVGGFKPMETNKSTLIGYNIADTVTVMPEPVTLCLVGLGGLLLARRRRA